MKIMDGKMTKKTMKTEMKSLWNRFWRENSHRYGDSSILTPEILEDYIKFLRK